MDSWDHTLHVNGTRSEWIGSLFFLSEGLEEGELSEFECFSFEGTSHKHCGYNLDDDDLNDIIVPSIWMTDVDRIVAAMESGKDNQGEVSAGLSALGYNWIEPGLDDKKKLRPLLQELKPFVKNATVLNEDQKSRVTKVAMENLKKSDVKSNSFLCFQCWLFCVDNGVREELVVNDIVDYWGTCACPDKDWKNLQYLRGSCNVSASSKLPILFIYSCLECAWPIIRGLKGWEEIGSENNDDDY